MVHFPIALLTIFALLQLLGIFPKVRRSKTMRYIKLFLLLVGRAGVWAAMVTGDAAGEAGFGVKVIVERHALFAGLTQWIFGLLAIGYLLQWHTIAANNPKRRIIKLVSIGKKIGLAYIFALAGLAAITITGALGGAMVYGPEADPVVKMVMELLHISYK